jgi:hypothetical protein
MKKLFVVLVSLGLALGASAQKAVRGQGKDPRPSKRVVIVRSYPPFSPYYGFGRSFYGYHPFGYHPFGYFDYGYRANPRPTKLDLQIEDIRNDYDDRIASVRRDDDLSRKEKRKKVQELKQERDEKVSDAKKSYYKTDSHV